VPAAKKGYKNDRGDYVVTTIEIHDTRVGIKKENAEDEESESDSDTEYDEEDDVKEDPKAEVKKEGKLFINVVFIVLFI